MGFAADEQAPWIAYSSRNSTRTSQAAPDDTRGGWAATTPLNPKEGLNGPPNPLQLFVESRVLFLRHPG
jgi:hypothetical protein